MCNVVRLPLASASANRRSIPYRIELWASVATTGQQQQGLPVDGLATDGSILSPRGTPTTHRASLVTTSQLFLLHLVYPISRHHNTMRGVSFVYLLIFSAPRERATDCDDDVRVCFRTDATSQNEDRNRYIFIYLFIYIFVYKKPQRHFRYG